MEATPNLLIKNSVPAGESFDGKSKRDIRIKDGEIAEIAEEISAADGEEVFDAKWGIYQRRMDGYACSFQGARL
ncbi:hypothetical protein [Rhodohalobacter sp.]|uniref:hypothetical protein n=1 Tax=Rhodohalobacter sp. TaxID=1974210 RepID=UPI002ACEDBB2|nr:hypothetical protein [Rhodohalobacter sp.]MDZ7755417.1 hypothetical protein [Rhodohalobacter sp.]